MALERRDPVPPGTYSVFVLGDEEERWNAWMKEHAGTVRPVLAVAKNDGTYAPLSMEAQSGKTRSGLSVLFTVTAPTPWVGLGLPTIETRSPAAWLAEEKARQTCYWVWTEAGPSVVCDETGPARIPLVATIAPWLLAGFLGWAFFNRRPSSAASRTTRA